MGTSRGGWTHAYPGKCPRWSPIGPSGLVNLLELPAAVDGCNTLFQGGLPNTKVSLAAPSAGTGTPADESGRPRTVVGRREDNVCLHREQVGGYAGGVVPLFFFHLYGLFKEQVKNGLPSPGLTYRL